MRTPITPIHRRIFLISLALALIIIVGGSLWAASGSITSFAGIGSEFLGVFQHLTDSNLIVKADKTKLAANGTSQTKITATHPKLEHPLTAEVTAGSGTITKDSQTDTSATFTYTAGKAIGPVTISVTTGAVTETVQLELVEPVAPAVPQIVSPANNSTTNLLKPEIIGTGPANTKIVISNNGQVNTTTRTDKTGAFTVKLERGLGNGQQTITAIAVSDLDIPSAPSIPLILTIQSEPLKYDASNIRFSPAKIVAGNSFAPFIPVSLNTERVVIELEGVSYELKDTNGVSIFSHVIPAPAQPGSYSANIILIDAADVPTKFENALKFTVVAP